MLVLLSTLALAAELTPTLDANVGGSYNRVGTQLTLQPGVKLALWNQPDSALFGDTYLQLAADIRATPAFARGGLRLKFAPLAMFDLTLYGLYSAYFGNFQTVVGYEHWTENYGTNDDITAYVEAGGVQSTGHALSWGANSTLKGMVGPVILVLNGDLSRWELRSPVVEEAADYAFERDAELMMRMSEAGGDVLWQGNGLLLYHQDLGEEGSRFLRVGNLTTWRKTWTGDDTLVRSGVIGILATNEAHVQHVLIGQVYLVDRVYGPSSVPFFAYQLKLAL